MRLNTGDEDNPGIEDNLLFYCIAEPGTLINLDGVGCNYNVSCPDATDGIITIEIDDNTGGIFQMQMKITSTFQVNPIIMIITHYKYNIKMDLTLVMDWKEIRTRYSNSKFSCWKLSINFTISCWK